MSNNKDNQDLFSDYRKPEDKVSVDIPAEQSSTYVEKIPSAYNPVGEIYSEGRAMRGMSTGAMPLWVLLTGWALFGGFFFLLLGVAISSSSLFFLPSLLLALIPLLIVIRGTKAKLSNKKSRRR